MNLKLNNTSISDYVAEAGYQIRRSYTKLGPDVKTLDGVIHPGQEKELVTLVVPVVGLSTSEYHTLFSYITRPTVQVTYDDPDHGTRTITCTTSDNSVDLLIEGVNTTDYWDGLVLEFSDCGN